MRRKTPFNQLSINQSISLVVFFFFFEPHNSQPSLNKCRSLNNKKQNTQKKDLLDRESNLGPSACTISERPLSCNG